VTTLDTEKVASEERNWMSETARILVGLRTWEGVDSMDDLKALCSTAATQLETQAEELRRLAKELKATTEVMDHLSKENLELNFKLAALSQSPPSEERN
jgi:predicted nuclease with TOPRIM domain